MKSWQEAAEELAEIVREDQEHEEQIFEAGVRVGRFAALLSYPLEREALIDEGRRAGLVEGFEQGVAHAERQRAEGAA